MSRFSEFALYTVAVAIAVAVLVSVLGVDVLALTPENHAIAVEKGWIVE